MATHIHDAGGRGHSSEPKTHRLSAKSILEQHYLLRIDPRNIKTDHKPHAKGGQADITSGTLKRRTGVLTRVAVKKLRYDGQTDNDKFSKSFASEVDILAGLSHTNIVELIGFLEDLESGNACLVFTWEENGNVQEFLARRTCDIPERISLIKDVTDGVKYLHTRQPPICHGDLKSLNILVNSLYRAVITDFGSARVLRGKRERKVTKPERRRDIPGASAQINISVTGNQLTLTGPSWSLRWASPEVVGGEDPDLPSDMWALGWVVWEIMTDKVPFHEICNEIAVTMAVIEKKNPSDIGNDEQMSQIISLCNLVRGCLAYDPALRPTATKCCISVKWMPSVVPIDTSKSSIKSRSAALLLNMGYMRYSQNDHDAAAALFNEALASAYAARDPLSAAEALNWLGEVGVAQQRYSDAESSFSQARDVHTSLGNASGRMRALDGLGGVYHAQCQLPKAEESFTEAEYICVQIGDDVGRANVLNGIGAVRHMRNKHSEARKCYEEALRIYGRVGNELGRANSLSGLGSVAHAQCHYEEAERIFTEAEGICVRVGNDMGRANVLNGLAAVHLAKDRYDEAEACYRRASEIFNRVGNDLSRANSLSGLGSVAHAQRHYEEAEERFAEAEGICVRIGNDMARGDVLSGLAAAHLAKYRYDEAEACYNRALDIFNHVGNCPGRANSLKGLGIIQHSRKQYEKAESSFHEAEYLFAEFGNDLERASVLNKLGSVRCMRHHYSVAMECFRRALEISSRTDNDLGRANSLYGLASVHHAQRQYEEAEIVLVKAEDICTQIGNEIALAHVLNGIAAVHLAKGSLGRAGTRYTLAAVIFGSVGIDSDRADCLTRLGRAYCIHLQPDEALKCFEEAKVIWTVNGHDVGHAVALEEIAEVHLLERRDSDRARACYTELLRVYSRIGDDSGRAYSMRGLGSVELLELQYDGAKEHFSEAESICTRIGDEEGRADAQRLISLAEVRWVTQMEALVLSVSLRFGRRRETRQLQSNEWRWDQPSFF